MGTEMLKNALYPNVRERENKFLDLSSQIVMGSSITTSFQQVSF